MPLIGSGLLSAGSAPAFVGAYDGISNLAAVYSVRRVLTSYTGPLLRLRRDSDNAEGDFGYVGATGDLDTAVIATWLGAATGYVAKLYEQSGNGVDAAQTTAASQPRLNVSLLGSKPGLEWFDTNNRYLQFAMTFPATMHAMTVFATTGTAPIDVLGALTPPPGIRINHSLDKPLFYLGGSNYLYFEAQTTYRNGNPHVHSFYIPGTGQNDVLSSTYHMDGTPQPVSNNSVAGAQGTTANVTFFRAQNIVDGGAAEMIISSAQLSTADHNAIGSSMAAYYGLTWNTIT